MKTQNVQWTVTVNPPKKNYCMRDQAHFNVDSVEKAQAWLDYFDRKGVGAMAIDTSWRLKGQVA